MFVSDGWDGVIRRITPAGDVTTYAGKSGQRGSADGPIQMARFNTPGGIAVDAAGNLYVCDYGNRTIRRITPQGSGSTVAGSAQPMGKENMRPVRDGAGTAARFDSPLAIASDERGNLFVVDAYTIRRITLAGVVSTIAGKPDQRGIKLGKTQGAWKAPVAWR